MDEEQRKRVVEDAVNALSTDQLIEATGGEEHRDG
jgi:hypothetical protein